MRFNRHDLIFHLRHTSFFFARNYFPNPASRPKLFSESRRPSEIIFFRIPSSSQMSVRKFLSERFPLENFGSIDSIIHSIRSILVEPAVGDRPGKGQKRGSFHSKSLSNYARAGFHGKSLSNYARAGFHSKSIQIMPQLA